MDHIQQFQQIIAEQQRLRALAQRATAASPVHAKVNELSSQPYYQRIGMPASERDINAYRNVQLIMEQDNHVHARFSEDDYFRFNYVVPVIDNIICFLADNITHLLIASNLRGPDTARVIRDLHENSVNLYNRYSRERSEFIEGVQFLRYKWYADYGLGLHVKNVHWAYLDEINRYEHAYRDKNANDLMAWCYTVVSLGFDQFQFLCDMQNKFNSSVPRSEHIVINSFRDQDCYGTIKAVQKFIKLCKWPHAFASERIAAFRDTMVSQMRQAPLNKIYKDSIRIKEMEGKTIRIA